jgi:hypothetical protein
MKNELPDFLIIPSILIRDKSLTPLDGQVYGIIYWFTKLKLQRCILSNSSIADLLGAKPQSIVNSLTRLKIKKYISVIMDDYNHRLEIVPNLAFTPPNLDPNSNELPPKLNGVTPLTQISYPPNSTELHNKIIKEDKLKREVIVSDKPKLPTQEKVIKAYERKPLDKQTQLQRICYYLEDILKTNIVNWGKQAQAMKMMLQAGYSEKQICFAIKYMAGDQFYEDKGFDLMTVANNIAQIKAQVRKEVKPQHVPN